MTETKHITVVGRLGTDPKPSTTRTGKQKVYFRLAVKRFDAESRQDVTDWYNVEAWNTLAMEICSNFAKGRRVIIIGEKKENHYTGRDGEPKTYEYILAREAGPALDTIPAKVKRTENGSVDYSQFGTVESEPIIMSQEEIPF